MRRPLTATRFESHVEIGKVDPARQPRLGGPPNAARLLGADGVERTSNSVPLRAFTSQTTTVEPRRTTMSSS